MPINEVEKVLSVFAGISAGDVAEATRYIHPEHFVQHNPYAADGAQGLAQFIEQAPRNELRLQVVRAIQDGPYVVTEAEGQRSGKNVFFDVFRFEEGVVVEHWAFSAASAPPNASGHTQTDGPAEPTHLHDTEKNKGIVRRYYETFHIGGDHSGTDR